jgi:hypothetical protein
MWVFGLAGLVFSLVAMQRISNIEKKLKQFDVIPRDFNPDEEPKETESD